MIIHSVDNDNSMCTFCILDEVTPGPAMRNRSVTVIFGSLVLWGLIIYFLISDQPVDKERETVSQSINRWD